MSAAPSIGLFDSLATRLAVATDRPCSIGVSATLHGDGATTVAIGVALSLAQAGVGPVLLVDANDVDPQLTEESGRVGTRGLSDYLAGRALADVVQQGGTRDLWFVANGSSADGRRARSEDVTRFLSDALSRFRYVIVDLPPTSAEAHVVPWLGSLDRSFIVVRRGGASIANVRRALEATRGSRSIDFIANEFDGDHHSRS
jgi:Mrp family chromosome partitioning ATPase